MFTSVWTTVFLGVAALGFFVYSLIKHEERLQEMERKITSAQEKFTNK
jgi:high-affinity Fe2+/Pb2+ permease